MAKESEKQDMNITSTTMRRITSLHKQTGRCIIGVSYPASWGERLIQEGERATDAETTEWFTKCPICNKDFHEEAQAETCQD